MLRRFAELFCAVILLWIPEQAHAFAIAPATHDLSGKRGETISGLVTVINDGNAEQTYELGAIKFVPNDASVPSFIPYQTDHSGLPEWIAFPVPSLSIPAKTKVDVPFTVTIPDGTPSGTVYAAITVAPKSAHRDAAIGSPISAIMASLLFVTIEGETIEKSALLDFVSSGDADGPFDLERSFVIRMQNQGNVAVVPSGNVLLTDVFGRTIASQAINEEGGRILPMTTRTFSGSIGPRNVGFAEAVRSQIAHPVIGPVTATLTLKTSSQSFTESFTYWSVPLHLIMTAAMAVVVLLVLWKLLSRGNGRLGQTRTGSL